VIIIRQQCRHQRLAPRTTLIVEQLISQLALVEQRQELRKEVGTVLVSWPQGTEVI